MSKKLIPVLIIVVAVAVFVILRATRPQPEQVSPAERSWPVAVMTARIASYQPAVPLYGQVVAPSRITLAAAVTGVIDQRPVMDGDPVAAGDLLISIDARDIEPLLAQASAEVSDLQAQLENEQVRAASDRQALERERRIRDSARRQLERTESLTGSNLASRTDLDNARDALERAELAVTVRQQAVREHPARLRSLQARLARAEATLAATRRDAERSRVVAPVSGVVTRVQASPGDRVTTGSPLLSLYGTGDLELQARIPATYQFRVQQAFSAGRSVEAAPEMAVAGISELPLIGFTGESTAAGPVGRFRIDTAGQSTPLRPGDMLPVVLRLPPEPGLVAVPYSALYGNDGLYRVNTDDRLQRLTVSREGELIQPDGTALALVRGPGLAEGDRIVITHLPNAVDGLKVHQADEVAP